MVLSALLLAACNSAPAYQGVEKKLATIDVQYYANTAKSAETGLIYAELYTRTAAEKEFIISSGFGADSIFYLGDSFFAAVKGEKQYVFNTEGKRIFDDGFESCHYYPDSLFILKQDGRYLIGMSDEYLAGEKGKFIVGGPYDKLVIGQHNEVFYCQQGIWSGFNAGQTLVLPGECLKIFALQAKDQQGEVQAGDEHEGRGDVFYERGVPEGDAGLFGGIASGAHDAERVAYAVEPSHPACPQQGYAGDGKDDVDRPDQFGGHADFRVQLVVRHAGGFRAEQLQVASPEDGQQGDGEADDTQAPDPLRQRPPEEHPLGHGVQMVYHGEPRGGEAGHGLEEGSRHGRNLSAGEERHHAQQGEHQPGEGDDAVSVTAGHPCLGPFAVAYQQAADDEVDARGIEEVQVCGFVIKQRDSHAAEE